MRILVTGGAGFIGSHLVEALVGEGCPVTVLDDLSTGRVENLARCLGRIELVVGSVLDEAEVGRLVATADRVVHLAATVGVERVTMHPARTIEVIEDGSRHVLGAAHARGVPTISVSSSEVYGFQPRTPVREEDVLPALAGDAPRLSYVHAKLAADRLGRDLHAARGRVLTMRPFNVVGPRQSGDGGAVLPRFVEAALAGAPVEVHGDGEQRRTFLDVRDLSGWLATLVKRDSWPFAAVNVGGTDERSIGALARRVVDRLGSSSPVRFIAPPALRGDVEVLRRVPDLSRLRTLIAASPTYTIDDSIDALAGELAAAPV